MKKKDEINYSFSIKHNGVLYVVLINHFEEFSPEEIEKYKITERSFFVTLLTPGGNHSFELFKNTDPLVWETNASSIVIDPDLVSIIGDRIDSLSM